VVEESIFFVAGICDSLVTTLRTPARNVSLQALRQPGDLFRYFGGKA
jgi:hypothetical protein